MGQRWPTAAVRAGVVGLISSTERRAQPALAGLARRLLSSAPMMPRSAPRSPASRQGIGIGIGRDPLLALCRSVGHDAMECEEALGLLRIFASTWSRAGAGSPLGASSVDAAEAAPFALALTLADGAPALQLLCAVQGEEPLLASSWAAVRALNERLAAHYGADLTRLALIEELFVPTLFCRRFAAWHGIALRRGAELAFTIHLNPQSRGQAAARAVIEEALARLGFAAAGAYLPVLCSGEALSGFALELSPGAAVRAEVHTSHAQATAERIEAVLAPASGCVPGQARRFCAAMAAGPGPYLAHPLTTCLSFQDGCPRPVAGSVHVPVGAYAESDRLVRSRLFGFLSPENGSLLRRVLAALAGGCHASSVCVQSGAALRVGGSGQHVTLRLTAEAFAVRRLSAASLGIPVEIGETACAE